MQKITEDELSYILYQLGEDAKPYRAVTPPMVLSSNFSFSTIDDYTAAIKNEKDISIYTRGNNPTVKLLEKKLAALQGTEDALVFGSGSGAIAAAVISQVKAGDHVVCIQHAYSWTYNLLSKLLIRFGVETTYVDGRNNAEVISAFKSNTRLLFLESPTSQSFRLQSLTELTAEAHQRGIIVICDNSFGSIINRAPVRAGVDLICHSATKFTSGHSDVVAGIVCGSNEKMRAIFNGEYMTLGAILSPHDAWMLIRSLRTLPMRLHQSANSCREVVNWLKTDERIAQVIWPFDPDHPQFALSTTQFDFEIPMFSFVLNCDDKSKVKHFCESLQVIQIAASWGGHESLIMPMVAFPETPHPFNQIRLYIGFESSSSLIADIQQALDKARI